MAQTFRVGGRPGATGVALDVGGVVAALDGGLSYRRKRHGSIAINGFRIEPVTHVPCLAGLVTGEGKYQFRCKERGIIALLI